ncbi:MAG: DUF502 domain-containing protein [Deltaproteobacteria bacterium]|nr:DUF502 domain-containing protein [Deltaproteobacteria bacterium]MBI2975001.1 DUF502 domain-containing protein [Deltaproteobacteria bacterium]
MKNFFKKYFIAGTLVTIPVAGTIWILKTIILWADGFFVSLLPVALQPSFLTTGKIPGVGLVLTIAIILIVGIFTRLYLGKKLISIGDGAINKIPFGRSVYNTLKQILHTAFTPGEQKFKGVCLVQYPIESSYAIAFITGESSANTSPDAKQNYLRVFVPTTPNPTSGFLLIVPENNVIRLNISVEEASKVIISGGLL